MEQLQRSAQYPYLYGMIGYELVTSDEHLINHRDGARVFAVIYQAGFKALDADGVKYLNDHCKQASETERFELEPIKIDREIEGVNFTLKLTLSCNKAADPILLGATLVHAIEPALTAKARKVLPVLLESYEKTVEQLVTAMVNSHIAEHGMPKNVEFVDAPTNPRFN